MQQICDGYNPQVKMGNWYEQSYSVPQISKTHPQKQSRDAQIDISYIDAHFKLRPLNRMARLPPWNTNGLVQAPQYKNIINKTTTKENFEIDTEQNYFRQWKPHLYDKANGNNNHNKSCVKINQFKKDHKMFNQQNVNELLNERNTYIPQFKSPILPNRHEDQKALMKTIYQRDISNQDKKINNSSIYKQNINHNRQQQNDLQAPAFRRIRSEITLFNTPPIHTYK